MGTKLSRIGAPMMTALPPAATAAAAAWRPIPLPLTTTGFCPAKTGMVPRLMGWPCYSAAASLGTAGPS